MKLKYLLLFVFLGIASSVFAQLKKVSINGATIHYLDKGKGVPIIFVHGGMEDYRTWDAQVDTFAQIYRVIAYSRRFNYPNNNTKEIKNFSAETEAKDLAALIVHLKLQPAHIVGHSFGALVVLTLAISHPELVKSITLSEPPMICWLSGLSGGKELYDEFYEKLLKPLKQDFLDKDTSAVLRHTIVYFYGSDLTKDLPPDVREALIANFPEWRSIALSENQFPAISKESVRNLKMPILLLSGGKTMAILQVTNKELRRVLPNANHFELAEGTHDYWITNPIQMGAALMSFLQTIR